MNMAVVLITWTVNINQSIIRDYTLHVTIIVAINTLFLLKKTFTN